MSARTAVVAVLVSAIAPAVTAAPARAEAVWFAEPVAHTMVTQTAGPSGFATPNSVIPWGLDRLDSRGPDLGEAALGGSYTYSSDGSGVKVYVLDSGVSASHPDFGSRVVDGWSYRADSTALTDYKNYRAAYDANPSVGIAPCASTFSVGGTTYERRFDPATFDAPSAVDSSDTGTTDNDGHGTHVAGIVAGTLTGVAKGATIVPVRALDSCGSGSVTMVRRGLEWIRDDHQPGERAVVNMSIGFGSTATSIDSAIRTLIAEGVVVVAAAGNDAATSCNSTPAGTAGTFSVGASTMTGGRDKESYFSNYGDCVDIFAPGQSVLSAWPYAKPVGGASVVDGWWVQSGTSMAAPHVAGAVARWLQGRSLTASSGSDVSASAWAWMKASATCDAVTYWSASRSGQTANRLLAVDATVKVPCGPSDWMATAGVRSGTVEFVESAAGNGSAVTGYTVTLTPGGQVCSIDPAVDVSPYSCPFTSLANGTTYTASLTATNSAGTGPARTTTFTTSALPVAVTGLTAVAGSSQAVVSWDAAEPSTTYTVTASPGGANCSTTGTTCTVTGLIDAATYTINVVGVNAVGAGPSASRSVTLVVPVTVRSVSATLGDRSSVVTWTGADPGVTYTATATPGGRSCSSTASTCTINGLTNGSMYTITVSGTNGVGTGGTTSTSLDLSVPSAVSIVVAGGNRAVTVSWTTVSTATGYVVTLSPGGRTCSVSTTTCTITGLTNGVVYTVDAVAVNAVGASNGLVKPTIVRPGFTVRITSVKKLSRTRLTSIMTARSTGARTWNVKGGCRISAGRLVAPASRTTCRLTLATARTSTWSAARTTVTISVR